MVESRGAGGWGYMPAGEIGVESLASAASVAAEDSRAAVAAPVPTGLSHTTYGRYNQPSLSLSHPLASRPMCVGNRETFDVISFVTSDRYPRSTVRPTTKR